MPSDSSEKYSFCQRELAMPNRTSDNSGYRMVHVGSGVMMTLLTGYAFTAKYWWSNCQFALNAAGLDAANWTAYITNGTLPNGSQVIPLSATGANQYPQWSGYYGAILGTTEGFLGTVIGGWFVLPTASRLLFAAIERFYFKHVRQLAARTKGLQVTAGGMNVYTLLVLLLGGYITFTGDKAGMLVGALHHVALMAVNFLQLMLVFNAVRTTPIMLLSTLLTVLALAIISFTGYEVFQGLNKNPIFPDLTQVTFSMNTAANTSIPFAQALADYRILQGTQLTELSKVLAAAFHLGSTVYLRTRIPNALIANCQTYFSNLFSGRNNLPVELRDPLIVVTKSRNCWRRFLNLT